ncbi:hypothetical protein PGT21_030968 [Puccinia graminis f. sp. tritici]|uniref:RING-type domain-containing protein n=1 Tax=Puccinia graminis f. sp. tritici TaxID=56615 RepID=A0A5B0NC64_PUCGR|nr:hypothetical protein PGT21_030968 [Puccinia graminis f. sp. tritici]KAA1086283.1 hypothetical protein PGTUg99_001921 [Puccinia graminis f. sp. tritici]
MFIAIKIFIAMVDFTLIRIASSMALHRPVRSGPSPRETYVALAPGTVADHEVYLSRDVIKEALDQRSKSRSRWVGANLGTWTSPNPICVFCNDSLDQNQQRAGPIPSCKHYSHGECLDKKGSSEENPCPTCKIEADIIQQALNNSGDGGIWDLVVKAYNHPIAKFLNCINLVFCAHYFNLGGLILRDFFNTPQ